MADKRCVLLYFLKSLVVGALTTCRWRFTVNTTHLQRCTVSFYLLYRFRVLHDALFAEMQLDPQLIPLSNQLSAMHVEQQRGEWHHIVKIIIKSSHTLNLKVKYLMIVLFLRSSIFFFLTHTNLNKMGQIWSIYKTILLFSCIHNIHLKRFRFNYE